MVWPNLQAAHFRGRGAGVWLDLGAREGCQGIGTSCGGGIGLVLVHARIPGSSLGSKWQITFSLCDSTSL